MSQKITFPDAKTYRFKQKQPIDSEEYLKTALAVEKTLRKYRTEVSDGIYWKKKGATWSEVKEDEVDLTFYSGVSGILYFYLKLYEVTEQEDFLKELKLGTKYLALHWKDFFEQSPIFGMTVVNDGLYMGVGGIGLVLGEIYKSIGDEYAKRGALQINQYYKDNKKEDENGIYWADFTAMAMDGGVILLLLQQYEIFKDEETKQLIEIAAKRYVKKGIIHEEGIEYNGWPGPGTRPNYEFGTSGSGYLLTLLYDLFGEDAYLETAKKCAEYIKSIKIDQKKGYLHPYDTTEENPIFFLSSCHGCGGNSKLYYKLYQITGDEKYLHEIEAMVDGIESVGAPEVTSAGFWNTLCFCCGHAGLVQYFIGLYTSLKDERYLELARRTARILLGEAEVENDGSVKWSMAFWRIKPNYLTVDLGYYDGISGIGSALLQAYQIEQGNFKWNRLLDDPFVSEKI